MSRPGGVVDSAPARALGTLAGVVGPVLAALVLWLLGAPRAEGVSVGEGRGLMFPDSGAAGGSQLLVLLVLLGVAVACAVLVLWHRHPGLRRPFGVYALAGIPALAGTMAAAAATPLADLVLAPSSDTPVGAVVALPPEVGPLFFGGMVPGTDVPSWSALPGWSGWFVMGAMVAAFVVAGLAHFSALPDLAAPGWPGSAAPGRSEGGELVGDPQAPFGEPVERGGPPA